VAAVAAVAVAVEPVSEESVVAWGASDDSAFQPVSISALSLLKC